MSADSQEPTLAQQALYDRVCKALAAVRDGDTETAEEQLLDALDGMVGFCNTRYHVFPDVVFRGQP